MIAPGRLLGDAAAARTDAPEMPITTQLPAAVERL